MAGLVIEVQAPIIVFREWHRHRTQSYNEASARYAPLPAVDYVPSLERMLINAGGSNKQAGTIAGAETLTEDAAAAWLQTLEEIQARAEKHYQLGLSIGVPKELARLSMTVGSLLEDAREREPAELARVPHAAHGVERAVRDSSVRERRRSDPRAKFPRTLALFKETQRV
jgi:hypothetical protein